MHTVWHDWPGGHVPALQNAPPAASHAGAGPTQEQPDASVWQVCPPGHSAKEGGQKFGGPPGPHRGIVVVVQRFSGRVVPVVVVVVVTVVALAGAQRSFAVVGTTDRLPN